MNFRSCPLLAPRLTQSSKSLRAQNPLRQRKNYPLFFVEMFARSEYRSQQQLPRLLELFCLLCELQIPINFLVLLVEGFSMADLLEAMLQRSNK